MSGRRRAPAVLLAVAVPTFVVSILGLIGSILLNAFVFDRFDAYGEVSIPGTAVVELPAGEVNITFHTRTLGSPGPSIPIPALDLTIEPPDWTGEPRLTESIGGTTIINNTVVRQRVWKAQVSAAGAYRVTVNGNVNAYIAPRLAFGHGSPFGWVPWAFGALLVISAIGITIAILWMARRRDAPSPEFDPDFSPASARTSTRVCPTPTIWRPMFRTYRLSRASASRRSKTLLRCVLPVR